MEEHALSSSVSELTNDKAPKPQLQKNDSAKLFRAGEDWEYNACLSYLPDNLGSYTSGYQEAMHRLFETIRVSVKQGNRSDLDIFVFPLVFVTRQYIELSLKRLLRDGKRLLGELQQNDPGFPATHNLIHLWTGNEEEENQEKGKTIRKEEACKSFLCKIGKKHEKECPELNIENQSMQEVEACLRRFSEVDDKSFAFRYPTNKKNQSSIDSKLLHINILLFEEVMEKLETFFDDTSLKILLIIEYKQEHSNM